MSWADLLIEMDVLFVLPALLALAFVACLTAGSATRLYRSAGGIASLRLGRGDHDMPAPMQRRLETVSNLRMK